MSALSQQETTRHILIDLYKGIANQDRKKTHKISTKEVPPWNSQLNILTEGFNRFNRAPTSPLVQMWIKTHTLKDFKSAKIEIHISNNFLMYQI